jgi:ABC-2 type transport system ATP-binding protein
MAPEVLNSESLPRHFCGECVVTVLRHGTLGLCESPCCAMMATLPSVATCISFPPIRISATIAANQSAISRSTLNLLFLPCHISGGDLVLSIQNLTKTYPGGVRALRGINLEIPPGMFGLLGPNGAGKSTLMKILATLLEPDSGSAHLDSLDLIADKNATRRLLGYLPQEFGVYPKMSATDLLNHLAIMKGITNRGERKQLVEGLLQQTNLWDFRKKALGGYSGGMKQRFGIAQALLANPKLIIVDEPTAGLDPAERNRFLNLLSSIGRSVVVILSTHIVDDVRELCSRMAVISNGKLLLEGVPAQTLEALRGRIWTKIVATDSEREALEKSMQVVSTHLVGGQHELRIYSESSPGEGFSPVDAELEDVYFLTLSRYQRN